MKRCNCEYACDCRSDRIAKKVVGSVVRHVVLGTLLPGIGTAIAMKMDVADAVDVISTVADA